MATQFESIRYWDTTQTNFVYPELDPNDPLYCSTIASRPNSGICVSGGGSVSASLIAGYYSALTDLNLMQYVRYISGVSGGTWGSAPYSYLPSSDTNFFGTRNMPADVTVLNITGTVAGSMNNAAVNADIVDSALGHLAADAKNKTPIDRVYEEAVGSLFLVPFGIQSPSAQNANPSYFSLDATTVANIQSRNSSLTSAAFMTMAPDRPFLIMNMTMFVPDGTGNTILPFEVTPLYAGIKAQQNVQGTNNQLIGGAFVESFGFNTTLSSANNGTAAANGDMPFELCQPVGASGSALEELLVASHPELLKCFPNFHYWNPNQTSVQTESYNFGDGGCIEDTGVTPLLARGVENIIMFLTEPVYFVDNPQVPISSHLFGELAFGYNQIARLFGEPTIDAKASKDANAIVWTKAVMNTLQTQVFDNTGTNNFSSLISQLYNAKTQNGGPLMVTMEMNVIPNPLFGIETAYQPTIMWSVVDTCSTWFKALPELVRDYMNINPNFNDFPEVQVFGQNIASVIELTAGQTNQLSNLAYWMVETNKTNISNLLQSTVTETASAI